MMFRPERCCVVIVATAILHNIMYRPETACTKSTMQPATVTMIRGGEGDDRQPNNLSSTDAKQFNCVFCDTSMTFCTHLVWPIISYFKKGPQPDLAATSPVVSFNGRLESRDDKTCSRLPLGHDSRCHAPGVVPCQQEVVSDSETMQFLYSGCHLNVHTSHTRMYCILRNESCEVVQNRMC